MMTTRLRTAAVVFAGLIALVSGAALVYGWTWGPPQRAWISSSGAQLQPADGAVGVGDAVELRFGDGCAQVLVDGSPSPCAPLQPGTSQVSTLRFDDRRIVLVTQRPGDAAWNPEIAGAERLVEWSSIATQGSTDQFSIGPDGTRAVAWEMARGEEPWGVQLLDGDGALITSIELVGLPGD